MKMPKPTKADLICGLLSYWDPLAFEGKAGPMFYNYEAEILAQSVRKNSKPENVAKKVRELIEDKMRVEGVRAGALKRLRRWRGTSSPGTHPRA